MTAAERRTTAALMTRSKASASTDLLTGALRHPASLTALALPDWERLVREARRADLLSRIACLAEAQRVLDDIPAAPRAHLQSARVLAAAQHEEVRREVRHVAAALRPLEVPIVLLKGAAYVMAGRGAALGRLFSDIDILVPKERIAEVEGALMMRGWMTTHQSAYDQRYYREWMHELPPLQHIQRQTTLDVHHAILPLTARLQPDPAKLMAASVAIEGDGGALRVLAPCDMILHGMAHLLHNEDLSHGLRDLSDFDLLLREHGTDRQRRQRHAEDAEGVHRPVQRLAGPAHAARCTAVVLWIPVGPRHAGHAPCCNQAIIAMPGPRCRAPDRELFPARGRVDRSRTGASMAAASAAGGTRLRKAHGSPASGVGRGAPRIG
jgi:hypothetical protein